MLIAVVGVFSFWPSAAGSGLRHRSPRSWTPAIITVLPPNMMFCFPSILARREILLPVSCPNVSCTSVQQRTRVTDLQSRYIQSWLTADWAVLRSATCSICNGGVCLLTKDMLSKNERMRYSQSTDPKGPHCGVPCGADPAAEPPPMLLNQTPPIRELTLKWSHCFRIVPTARPRLANKQSTVVHIRLQACGCMYINLIFFLCHALSRR